MKVKDLYVGCYYKATEDFPLEITSETWFKKDRIILMTERMLKVFLITKTKDKKSLYEFLEGVELTIKELDNLGFGKREKMGSYDTYIAYVKGDFSINNRMALYLNNHRITDDIKYTHELQLLLFALNTIND